MVAMRALVQNTIWALVPLALVLLGLRPVTGRALGGFASRYGLSALPEASEVVHRLVRRSRAGRMLGAALGLCLPSLALLFGASLPGTDQGGSFVYGFAGYVAGAFVAALLPVGSAGPRRSAALEPRRAADYLPRGLRSGPVVAVVASGAASVVYGVEVRTMLPTYGAGSTLSFGIASAVVGAAATVIAIRVIVSRPQPIVSPELTAVDDALRSQALHTISGAGLAFAFLGAATCLLAMGGAAANPAIHTAGWVAALVAFWLSITAWLSRTSPWLVSRAV
jgi:hypothetical protein